MAAESIFRYFDTDRNGYLDPQEVRCFAKQVLSAGNAAEVSVDDLFSKMFKLGDENGDNKLSLKELTYLMLRILEYKKAQR